MGAQDPFVEFEWLGQVFRTPTLDGAGRYAYFNSEFWLEDFLEERDAEIKFEAYDDDGMSCDFLCRTLPFTIRQILEEYKENNGEPLSKLLVFHDSEEQHEIGDLQIIFELQDSIGNLYKEVAPPPVIEKGKSQLNKESLDEDFEEENQ